MLHPGFSNQEYIPIADRIPLLFLKSWNREGVGCYEVIAGSCAPVSWQLMPSDVDVHVGRYAVTRVRVVRLTTEPVAVTKWLREGS